ncbi:hypothetical protein E4T49_00932 [Aureobasidium sp. EXF-10728]|nr:hypothetical protein E4T49_00932 [Aureobasidium sp. EXF-10728]
MSTPPAPKRRRVDSVGIHKPFVSPLKRNSSPAGPQNLTTITTTPKPTTRATPQAPITPYTPLRSSNLKPHTPPPLSHNTPEILAAQSQIRALESRIRDLRNQTSILSQAHDITVSTSQQPRLLALEEKWRKASQQAAEEVYISFAEKIKENGGYTAFLKQQQRKPQTFFNEEQETADETNEEDWRDEQGDCLTERGKRQRRCEIERGKTLEEEEVEEEEEELTLGSMLQVLNIAPEVIGWDTETLAWK